MDRKIKIVGINNDEPFEVPKRKPKHRILLYEKMAELAKQNPELFKNREYRIQMESAYLALYIIQEKFPKITIDHILNISDDMEDYDNILRLSCIVYGTDYDSLKKNLLPAKEKNADDEPNFQKQNPKIITPNN